MFAPPPPLAIGDSRPHTPVPARALALPRAHFGGSIPRLTPLARATPLPASSLSRGRRLLSLLPPPRAAAARCRHVQTAAPCHRCAYEPLVPSSPAPLPRPAALAADLLPCAALLAPAPVVSTPLEEPTFAYPPSNFSGQMREDLLNGEQFLRDGCSGEISALFLLCLCT